MYVGCLRGKGQYVCCIVSVADDKVISYYYDTDTDNFSDVKHSADDLYNALNQTITVDSSMNILKAKICVLNKRTFQYVYSSNCFYLVTD